jgi:hypothetical protein
MAKTILWNRDEQDVVHVSGRTLVFASSADADVWLARGALKRNDSKIAAPRTGVTAATFDKISVT